MLESAIFLVISLPCSYKQLIYLTILAFLCSSYSVSETASYFITVVPLIGTSFQVIIGGNWSICFTTGYHDLLIFNPFLAGRFLLLLSNSDVYLWMFYLQLLLIAICISQGSVAHIGNHFSYFKQKEIKYKVLGA